MKMHDGDVADWEDFERRIKDLRQQYPKDRQLVFRGLGDSTWPLTTTLERYDNNIDMPFAEYHRVISAAEPHIRTFNDKTWDTIETYPEILKMAAEYGFEQYLWGGQLQAYGYMAYLRHQGFPSPLMDWTRSPYVAAFFAFRSAVKPPHDRVSVFVFCESPTGMKGTGSDRAEIKRLGPYVRAHRRHYLQQGEYTICIRWEHEWRFVSHETILSRDGDGTQDLLWKFNIPFGERTKVLKLLDAYNVNAFSLFDTNEALLETIAMRELTFRPNQQ